MKRILKGVVGPLFLAMFIGFVGGRFVYKVYKDNLYDNLRSSRLYLVEKGEYDSIDTMREDNMENNYVYYKDNDKYKTVVGITRKYDNIDKIKELYSDNLSVMEYYVANDILSREQDEYEKMLMDASDLYQVKEAVDNILNLYRSDDSIRLIAVN